MDFEWKFLVLFILQYLHIHIRSRYFCTFALLLTLFTFYFTFVYEKYIIFVRVFFFCICLYVLFFFRMWVSLGLCIECMCYTSFFIHFLSIFIITIIINFSLVIGRVVNGEWNIRVLKHFFLCSLLLSQFSVLSSCCCCGVYIILLVISLSWVLILFWMSHSFFDSIYLFFTRFHPFNASEYNSILTQKNSFSSFSVCGHRRRLL